MKCPAVAILYWKFLRKKKITFLSVLRREVEGAFHVGLVGVSPISYATVVMFEEADSRVETACLFRLASKPQAS